MDELSKCISAKGCPKYAGVISLHKKMTKCSAITDKAACNSDADCYYTATTTASGSTTTTASGSDKACGPSQAVMKEQFVLLMGNCKFVDIMVDMQFCTKYSKTDCSGNCVWGEAKTDVDVDCDDCVKSANTCQGKTEDNSEAAGCQANPGEMYAAMPDYDFMMWLDKKLMKKCTAAKSQSACEGVTVDLSAGPPSSQEGGISSGTMQKLTVFFVSCFTFVFVNGF